MQDRGKGKDHCVERPDTTDCKFCNILTSDQRAELSTPSYKMKEKREAKKMDVSSTPSKDSLNSSLVDPASVLVIGAVDSQGTLKSPGFNGPEENKAKKVEKETSKAKSSGSDKPAKHVPDSNRSPKASTDAGFAELDQ